MKARNFGVLSLLGLAVGCTTQGTVADSGTPSTRSAVTTLPADGGTAVARLNASPRHGEWAMIRSGVSDSVKAWVVYPERSSKAPVVIVVHEIYGLTPWIRSVADQLAADGFIAIAPDLLTMKNLPEGTDSASTQAVVAAVRTLDQAWVQRQIDAVAQYGMALPAAVRKYGIVGFCWGGSVSFTHATHSPTLGASVVYYGSSPRTQLLASVRAPVLGLYGGNDARVNATIPAADSALRAMGKTYVRQIYPGAGHGFLRQQPGMEGANMAATRAAWPATISWFRKYLGS